MSRAGEKAIEKYPEKITGYIHDGGTPLPYDANVKLREAFIKGFAQAQADILKLVEKYITKGERCYELSEDNRETDHCNFWDGFKNCAENIKRDIDNQNYE